MMQNSARIEHKEFDGGLEINFEAIDTQPNHDLERNYKYQVEAIQEEVEDSSLDYQSKQTGIKPKTDIFDDNKITDAEDPEDGDFSDDAVPFFEYKYCTICHIE
jgi:hypothetical protein